MRTQIPQPPDAGLINAIRFGTNPFRFLEGIQARFDDLVAIPLPGRAPLVIVTSPALVHNALSQPEAFSRIAAQNSGALIAENGIVQSEGDLWQQQRSIMGPAFSGRQVRQYANTVGEHVSQLVNEWRGATGETRNLHREMTTLTIRVASDILLGEDIDRERAEQFHEWMQIAGGEFQFSPTNFLPEWLPTRSSQEFQRAAEGIRSLSEDIIEQRRARMASSGNSDQPTDALGLLLQAENDPAVDYPPNQIRDEIATFLIAGHETTALSLTYTLCLLSWHAEVCNRVREEAREVFKDGKTPHYDHVADLAYTTHVYQEGLRLHPPAWAVFRQASGKTRLGEYLIEEGSAMIMPQWSIHRDERYFENSLEFNPERWERRSPTAVNAYFPFGSGPHACIGSQFALTGAVLALARLSMAFELEVPTNALDNLQPTVTLRPSTSVPATIQPVN